MSGLIVKPGGLMDLFLMSGLIRNRSPSMVCGLSGQCRERNPEFFAKRLSQAFGQIGVPLVWVHGWLSITRRNWPPCRFRLRIEQPSPQAAPIQPLASRQSASPRHWLFQNPEPQRKNEPLSSLLIKAKERPRGKSLLIKGTHKSCGIKGSQATN